MRKIILIFVVMLMAMVIKAEVSEELKAQAQEYATLLEKEDWMIVPRQAEFPKTIKFMDMREDCNFFISQNNNLSIRIDFMGTRVTHALSEEQLFWLAQENAELWHMLEVAPPFFTAECTPVSKSVRISKNCKTVTMELSCNVTDSNFRDYNSIPSFTIRVDVKSGTAQIVCRGMHYDERFDGNIYRIQ